MPRQIFYLYSESRSDLTAGDVIFHELEVGKIAKSQQLSLPASFRFLWGRSERGLVEIRLTTTWLWNTLLDTFEVLNAKLPYEKTEEHKILGWL